LLTRGSAQGELMFNKLRFFWLHTVFDRGHRLYGVPPEAHDFVLEGIELIGGPRKLVTLDLGPSHQTILSDGFTVIHSLAIPRPPASMAVSTGTAMSFRVKDPGTMAKRLTAFLERKGFKSRFEDKAALVSMPPNRLVVVSSDAFLGWELGLTLPSRRMPLPNLK
jgi:hypothetical protein